MKKVRIVFFFLFNVFGSLLAQFYSQIGQDKFVYENYFKNVRNGFFVDIGAHDGITGSNTYFFEKHLGWKGVCFEPLPTVFRKLRDNRSCLCINKCVSSVQKEIKFILVTGYAEMLSGMMHTYDQRHWDRLKREIKQHGGNYNILTIPTCDFNEVMSSLMVKRIDFLSIDTEGSELEILQSINYELFDIKVIAVENNYKEPFVSDLLKSKGFNRVAYLGDQDEIFVNVAAI